MQSISSALLALVLFLQPAAALVVGSAGASPAVRTLQQVQAVPLHMKSQEDKEFEEFSATVNGLPAVVSPDSANAGVPREKVKTPAPPAPAPASCFAIETPSP